MPGGRAEALIDERRSNMNKIKNYLMEIVVIYGNILNAQ